MRRTQSFEKNLETVDEIIEKLEKGDLTLEESIKEYEKAMKSIKNAKDIINQAEGKLLKVINHENDIKIENFEGGK